MRKRMAASLGGALLTLVLAASPAVAVAVDARPAEDFVDSVGVNVHLGYYDTAYNNRTLVKQRMLELGVHHARDGVVQKQYPVWDSVRDFAAAGIRFTFIVGHPTGRYGSGTLDQQLDVIDRELGAAVESLEGPNEYDLQGDPDWASTLRDYQRRLYEGAKSRPGLAARPVVGPSLVYNSSRDRLGDISAWVDHGNVHPYPGGYEPDRPSHLDSQFALAAKNTGSKLIQATETGYHNSLTSTSGHLPASERAAGIYTPRLLLENFRRGIGRTFLYELVDQWNRPGNPEANFGLLRSDFSPKPAFTATRQLLELLRDPGAPFVPEGLDYTVEGAPASMRQLLLQKRDGRYYLVLWNQASVWDPVSRTERDPPDLPVTLRFGSKIARATTHALGAGAAPPITARSLDHLPLVLSERVQVIELEPASGHGAAPPAPKPQADIKPGRGGQPKSARAPQRTSSASLQRLRRDERRRVRSLRRKRGTVTGTSSGRRSIRRLEHWLDRRVARLRRISRRRGWRGARRARYRIIRRVLVEGRPRRGVPTRRLLERAHG